MIVQASLPFFLCLLPDSGSLSLFLCVFQGIMKSKELITSILSSTPAQNWIYCEICHILLAIHMNLISISNRFGVAFFFCLRLFSLFCSFPIEFVKFIAFGCDNSFSPSIENLGIYQVALVNCRYFHLTLTLSLRKHCFNLNETAQKNCDDKNK